MKSYLAFHHRLGPASLELSQLVRINLNCFRYMLRQCHFPYIIFWVGDVYTSIKVWVHRYHESGFTCEAFQKLFLYMHYLSFFYVIILSLHLNPFMLYIFFSEHCRNFLKKIMWVRVKGHIGQGQRILKKGGWAHNNVKLLHFIETL